MSGMPASSCSAPAPISTPSHSTSPRCSRRPAPPWRRLAATAHAVSPAATLLQPRRRESIDVAVMERAANVACAPVSMGWSDVGSFDVLHALTAKDDAGNALSRPGLCHRGRQQLRVQPGTVGDAGRRRESDGHRDRRRSADPAARRLADVRKAAALAKSRKELNRAPARGALAIGVRDPAGAAHGHALDR